MFFQESCHPVQGSVARPVTWSVAARSGYPFASTQARQSLELVTGHGAGGGTVGGGGTV